MKYIRITSTKDKDLITLLNSPEYANYTVITIMKSGIEDVAYLELDEPEHVIEVKQPKGKTK